MKRLMILAGILAVPVAIILIVGALNSQPEKQDTQKLTLDCMVRAEDSYNNDLKNNSVYTTKGDAGQDVYHVSSENTKWIDQKFADAKQTCTDIYKR